MPSYSGIWSLPAQMQAEAAGNWPVPPPSVIGQAYGGGFYAGQISTTGDGVATHYLIVGPVSTAQSGTIYWRNANSDTIGAASVIDGPQNTADMVADGTSTVYPSAHFCNDLTIGGYSDWYMPSQNELEICYYNLKPVTTSNSTSSGANTNAVPARASNYTSGTPPQTSATAFQTGNAEAFTNAADYWSSTESSSDNLQAYVQRFSDGRQEDVYKNNNHRVRAVRRVPI
jgi:hypothetical protein